MDEADKLFELDNGGKNKNQEEDVSEQEEESESENEGENSDNEGSEKAPAERVRTSFLSQVDEILSQCPSKGVQRALFSATVGPFVKELASSFLSNPVSITIGKENAGASTINQKLMFVGREDGKLLAIRQIIQAGLRPPVLLFLQSIDRAKVNFALNTFVVLSVGSTDEIRFGAC